MKTLIFDLEGTLVQLAPTLVCFADITELTLLRKHYNFALVTGSTRIEVEWALAHTNLAPLFNSAYIVSVEDTQSEKASGKPFQEIQQRLKGSMVMIGDSTGDETGSALANLPFVRITAFPTPEEQRQELRDAIREAEALLKSVTSLSTA